MRQTVEELRSIAGVNSPFERQSARSSWSAAPPLTASTVVQSNEADAEDDRPYSARVLALELGSSSSAASRPASTTVHLDSPSSRPQSATLSGGRGQRPPTQPGRKQNPRKIGASGGRNQPMSAASRVGLASAEGGHADPDPAHGAEQDLSGGLELSMLAAHPIHDWGRRPSSPSSPAAAEPAASAPPKAAADGRHRSQPAKRSSPVPPGPPERERLASAPSTVQLMPHLYRHRVEQLGGPRPASTAGTEFYAHELIDYRANANRRAKTPPPRLTATRKAKDVGPGSLANRPPWVDGRSQYQYKRSPPGAVALAAGRKLAAYGSSPPNSASSNGSPPARSPPGRARAPDPGQGGYPLSGLDMSHALIAADAASEAIIDVERREHARRDAALALRKWVDACTTRLRTSALHLRCDIHFQAVRLSAMWTHFRRQVDEAKARQRRQLGVLLATQGASIDRDAAADLQRRALFLLDQGLLPVSTRVQAAVGRHRDRATRRAEREPAAAPGESLILSTLALLVRRSLSATLAHWLHASIGFKRSRLVTLAAVRARARHRLCSPLYLAFRSWAAISAISAHFALRLSAGLSTSDRHAVRHAFALLSEHAASASSTLALVRHAAARLMHMTRRGAWEVRSAPLGPRSAPDDPDPPQMIRPR